MHPPASLAMAPCCGAHGERWTGGWASKTGRPGLFPATAGRAPQHLGHRLRPAQGLVSAGSWKPGPLPGRHPRAFRPSCCSSCPELQKAVLWPWPCAPLRRCASLGATASHAQRAPWHLPGPFLWPSPWPWPWLWTLGLPRCRAALPMRRHWWRPPARALADHSSRPSPPRCCSARPSLAKQNCQPSGRRAPLRPCMSSRWPAPAQVPRLPFAPVWPGS
mmetsp:Transcript_3127/g.7304  ORF Transcript_3127/g.7304 Transcript_3127/m.7304 type:complete len:219 (+) Transcript_3127:1222-1878(+)